MPELVVNPKWRIVLVIQLLVRGTHIPDQLNIFKLFYLRIVIFSDHVYIDKR